MSKKKTEDISIVETVEVNEVETPEMETVCYVGPTIPGVIQHAGFFRNGLPEHLEKAVEKCPALKGLMIPVSSLTTVDNGSVAILSKEVLKWAGIKEV